MDPILSSLIYIVVVLVVVGLLLWAITQIPMDATIQRLVRVIIIVGASLFTIVILLRMFGIALPGPH